MAPATAVHARVEQATFADGDNIVNMRTHAARECRARARVALLIARTSELPLYSNDFGPHDAVTLIGPIW